MSETTHARPFLAKYCRGLGLDIGFGGDAIVPTAITFDMERPYCPSFAGHKQIMKGDCKNLSMFCNESMDYIYSSHLLEDFTYGELKNILAEWRRVLKPDGYLITNCPDQQKFLAHCHKTGQPLNLAHKEQGFSLHTFKRVATSVGEWEEVFVEPSAGPYSFYLVLKKIKT